MSKFHKVENTSDLQPSGPQDATAANAVIQNSSDVLPSGPQDATAANAVMDTTIVSSSECKGCVKRLLAKPSEGGQAN